MARIRSIHPSLFTDEAWVSCTPLARVLYIGLMTDADDQGLFEWKPLQIKMRLLPADTANIPDLLDELVSANLISPLEADSKKLGAIRYFRRFQRPKKPNSLFPLPPEWGPYVGLTATGSDTDGEPVPNRFRTGGEKSPQMEDGRGRIVQDQNLVESASPLPTPERIAKPKARASSAPPSPLQATVDAIWAAAPALSRRRSSRSDLERTLGAAVKRGHTPEAILAGLRAYFASDDVTRDDGRFAKGIHRMVEADRWAEFANATTSPIIALADLTDEDWNRRLRIHAEGADWPDLWGPAPGQPGCAVPSRLVLAAA